MHLIVLSKHPALTQYSTLVLKEAILSIKADNEGEILVTKNTHLALVV